MKSNRAARPHPSPRDYLLPPRLLFPLSTLLSWPRLPVCAIFFPLSLFPPFISLPLLFTLLFGHSTPGFDSLLPILFVLPSSREEGSSEREGESRTQTFFTRGGGRAARCFILSRNLWANRSPPLAVLNAIFKNAEVE